MVSPLALLVYIAGGVGGLKLTNAVALLAELPEYWAIDPCVPHYIMKMEDVQRKSARANIPVTDNWLAAFETNSLLRAKSYPTDRLGRDGKPRAAQTWQAWNKFLTSLHKNLERHTRMAQSKDSLRTTISARLIHSVESAEFSDKISGLIGRSMPPRQRPRQRCCRQLRRCHRRRQRRRRQRQRRHRHRRRRRRQQRLRDQRRH